MKAEKRMATPLYRSEHVRSVFALGMLVGAIIGGATAAYTVVIIMRLTA